MQNKSFEGTAWKNAAVPASPAGYGIKIDAASRDSHFDKSWKFVQLDLPQMAEPVIANIDKKSFWNGTCRELINSRLGEWMISQKLAPWPKGRPPKLLLEPIAPARFRVHLKKA